MSYSFLYASIWHTNATLIPTDVLRICRVSGPPLVYKGPPWGVTRAATGIHGDWQC